MWNGWWETDLDMYLFRSRGLTREVNKIERNMVTCYIYGSAFAGKSAFVDAFVERKTPAPMADGDDEETILRAISAVIDKDATKYLLVRVALVNLIKVVWSDLKKT